jgi:DNA-directed RNA polymerase subunit beta'
MMGAEAIKELLRRSIEAGRGAAREDARRDLAQKKLKFAKRLKVVDAFRKSATSRSG